MMKQPFHRMAIAAATACLWLSLAPSQGFADTIHIVALGDSLVLGQGTSFAGGSGGVVPADSYPAIIQRMLTARGWSVEVANKGINAEISAQTLARVDRDVPAGTALTIVQVGSKDMLEHIPVDTVKANLRAIHDAVMAKGSDVLIVLPAGAQNRPPGFVVWNDGMRDPGSHWALPQYDSGDHEHFNAAGNTLIATRAIPDIEAALRRRGLAPDNPPQSQ